MSNGPMIFRVKFSCETGFRFELPLSQVPSKGDKLYFNRKRFEVVDLEWRLDVYKPGRDIYQAEVLVIIQRVE